MRYRLAVINESPTHCRASLKSLLWFFALQDFKDPQVWRDWLQLGLFCISNVIRHLIDLILSWDFQTLSCQSHKFMCGAECHLPLPRIMKCGLTLALWGNMCSACVAVSMGGVSVRRTKQSSHSDILSAVFGSHLTVFMQILLFYINLNCNVWRFGRASFESTLKAGVPQGHQNLFECKCVCSRSRFCICVCPVFVVLWAQGHQRCHHCPSFSHPS